MPEFDRSTPVTVALRCPRGTVDITAEDRTTVVAEVVPLDGSDASRAAAAATTITLDGDTLVVHAAEEPGRLWHRSAALALSVRVPTGSSIAADTASADVRAAGRFTTVRITTASGDVAVEDVTGDAVLQAASGDVRVGRAGGALRISSSSGDLEAGDVTGDVSADTASGDIGIRSAGSSVGAKSASGDITIGVVSRGKARVRSASGDVTVGVAAGTGVWLDVNTVSGSTRNDLTMGTGEAPATGASLQLRVTTVSGDITIRRVTAPSRVAA